MWTKNFPLCPFTSAFVQNRARVCARDDAQRKKRRSGKTSSTKTTSPSSSFLSSTTIAKTTMKLLLFFFFFFFLFERANAELQKLEGRTLLVTSSRAFPAPAFLNVRPRRDFDAGTHHVPINPLTANGTETWPIGYADVFSLKRNFDERGKKIF